jgi:hypothetical protein
MYCTRCSFELVDGDADLDRDAAVGRWACRTDEQDGAPSRLSGATARPS